MMHERPDGSTLDPLHSLARGMVLGPPLTWGGYKYVPMRGPKGTLTNMTPADDWQWSGELGRRVLDFDGTTQYADLPGLPNIRAATHKTLVCWYKGPYQGDRSSVLLGRLREGSSYPNRFGHGINVSLNVVRVVSGSDDLDTSDLVATCPLNQWVSLVATFSGESASEQAHLYVGGILANSYAGPIGYWAGGNARLANACDGTSNALNGLIADPLIFSRALTPSEIQQLADPSNVMLSGLILPPRRRVWPSAVVPLSLPDYPDVSNESPFEDDESIVTVAATGGSAPVSYAITAQSTTAGMLKVTGALTPDATGIYTENGTYGGQPAYERADGSYWFWWSSIFSHWFISDSLGGGGDYFWEGDATIAGDYVPYEGTTTGTATVANYEPFAIDSATGAITIADASGLAVGQTWTLTVRATDALSDTDDGTVTVELVSGAVFNPAWAARCNNLIGAGI